MGALFELAERQNLQEFVFAHSQNEIVFSTRIPLGKHRRFIAELLESGEQLETLIQTKLTLIIGIR